MCRGYNDTLSESDSENITAEQINAGRGGPERGPRKACIHRDASIEDNLSAFRKMKDGGFAPSEAVLRMKQDFENPSPQMWDLIAYRTLRKPHHRTGNDWCIYPTYDFTHCLCDSFENITYVSFGLEQKLHAE